MSRTTWMTTGLISGLIVVSYCLFDTGRAQNSTVEPQRQTAVQAVRYPLGLNRQLARAKARDASGGASRQVLVPSSATSSIGLKRDRNDTIELCQYTGSPYQECESSLFFGVDETRCNPCREPHWKDARLIPWEIFAQGEYIGPARGPHVPVYRIRVDDEIEFVYRLTREESDEPYRIQVGDILSLTSSSHAELAQQGIVVQPDGTISLHAIQSFQAVGMTLEELQKALIKEYSNWFENVWITVIPTQTNLPLEDLRDAVDGRASVTGGQSLRTQVSPDGTIQLPWLGSIPVVGLSLDEAKLEINARYHDKVVGIAVTPVLTARAVRVVYVLGEVNTPGRYTLNGPTTAIQSIALAEGWRIGGNLRQIVVIRRDDNFRMIATKIDLAGALYGERPHPTDDIWLRDLDIVLVPKTPIRRTADFIDAYFTQTIYAVLPNNGFSINFDGLGLFGL